MPTAPGRGRMLAIGTGSAGSHCEPHGSPGLAIGPAIRYSLLPMLRRLQQEILALWLDEDSPESLGGPAVRRFLRFWVTVIRAFTRNRCAVRASALAYSSLLAFIPLFAVVIGVATSVLKGERERINEYLNIGLANLIPQLKENAQFVKMKDDIVAYTFDGIDKVNSGTLGTTGMVALLAVIIFMLARIEETLNDIWGVSKGRSWYSRVVNYWAAISLGPVVMLAAISFSAALNLSWVKEILDLMPSVGSFLIKLAPVPVVGAAFALFYALVPNTKVEWRSALVGGMTAAILWHGVNQFSFLFVSQVNRNSKIFGTLVPIPVFMAGLYFSWLLLLFGSQVAYAYQNRRSHLSLRQTDRVNQSGREFVALRLMVEVGRCYARGAEAPTVAGLAELLEVPVELVRRISVGLLQARLVVEAGAGESGLVPGRPLDRIRVADVLAALRRGGGETVVARGGEGVGVVEAQLAEVAAAEKQAGARTLLELVEGVGVLPVA